MKRIIGLILIVILSLGLLPTTTYAYDEVLPEWQDIVLSQTEFESIAEKKTPVQRATGLIASYALGIKKSGNDLIIAGNTTCVAAVTKCGFKELVIQRRANSTQDWTDYVTYEDLYNDIPSYMLSKSITVGTGYQYRVTAIHYAKKNIFSTEKISNTSNTVVFA